MTAKRDPWAGMYNPATSCVIGIEVLMASMHADRVARMSDAAFERHTANLIAGLDPYVSGLDPYADDIPKRAA